MQAMIDGAQIGQVFVGDAGLSGAHGLDQHSRSTIRAISRASSSRPQDGRYVPMSSIATLKEAPIAPQLTREQQRRDVSVTADARWRLCARRRLSAACCRSRRRCCRHGDSILPLAEAKTIGDSN